MSDALPIGGLIVFACALGAICVTGDCMDKLSYCEGKDTSAHPAYTLRMVQPAGAEAVFQEDGAFMLSPRTVDSRLVRYIDAWLRSNVHLLLPYPVRMPARRLHALLLPSDCAGAIAEVVGQVAEALRDFFGAADLVELAAFVVLRGAEPQPIHADVLHDGFVSCQLALHDTHTRAGHCFFLPALPTGFSLK